MSEIPHPDIWLHDPRLMLFSLAAGAAQAGGHVDQETLDEMRKLVRQGGLTDLEPARIYPFIERGLMSAFPSRMLDVLSDCGALAHLLPEYAALSGCFQAGPGGDSVDIAQHQGRVLDQTARIGATLPIRWAALLFNLGKSDSPPQHLPTHYRHIDRCLPRIAQIGQRFSLSEAVCQFAVLVAMELERVHRASRMRADAVTSLLERVDAFDQRQRYQDLLTVCACDFLAYEENLGERYPKADLLNSALAACLSLTEEDALNTGESLHDLRVLRVAAHFRGGCFEEMDAD